LQSVSGFSLLAGSALHEKTLQLTSHSAFASTLVSFGIEPGRFGRATETLWLAAERPVRETAIGSSTTGYEGRQAMPLHLEPLDVTDDLENITSVLIVSCPVCPPVSLAVQNGSPFIEVFKSGLKTGAFEDHVNEIRQALEQRGVRTGVCTMYAPVPTMCLWTGGQRRRLFKRAKDYEAVLVLGCDSATYTVQQALKETDCQVIQAMNLTGITNATVKFMFPMAIKLEETTCLREGEKRDAV
jgi:hypothetical protein